MSISKEEIIHLAKLSKLKIDEEKIEKYITDLSSIVDMANEIKNINTDNIVGTSYILKNVNVFRKDEVSNSCDKDKILLNAKTKELGCISIPKVVQ